MATSRLREYVDELFVGIDAEISDGPGGTVRVSVEQPLPSADPRDRAPEWLRVSEVRFVYVFRDAGSAMDPKPLDWSLEEVPHAAS